MVVAKGKSDIWLNMPTTLRAIPDLMMSLQELHSGTVTQIRKTTEDPPRVSVVDTIALFVKGDHRQSAHTWQRLSQQYPEVCHAVTHFKFSGQGQRETPVADARGIVEIIMLLPGRAAAQVRMAAADVMVRYLGGDPGLVQEIAANRLTQEQLDQDDPARIFGQTVESEALKRKREDVAIAELDGREKRARVQAATDVAGMTLRALQDLGLPISDRDKMLAKDIITNAAFTAHQRIEDQQERDICLQQFCAEHGKKGLHTALGKRAKKLYLDAHPDYSFAKKDVYSNGQIVQANVWTESMRGYLERALQTL